MATRNNPMAGRYFNDPNLAVAMSSLASAFAPPGAEDYLVAEKIRGTRTQNNALGDLYAQAGNDPDKLAYIADLYDPTNGIGARNMADATARAKIEADNLRALEQTRLENEAKLRLGVLGAKANPEGSQFVSDEDLVATIGIPDMPGIARNEPVAPLTLPQVQAEAFNRGIADWSPEQFSAFSFGNTPLEQIIMDGSETPTYATRPQAIGQQAFNATGGKAQPDAIQFMRNGVRVGGTFENGQYLDSNGQPLTPEEQGTATKLGNPTGTLEEVGGVGQTVQNRLDTGAMASVGALDTIDRLLAEITTNPNSQGLVGAVRGTAQDIMATGSELGRFFGGTAAEVADAVNAGMIDQGLASEMYDPSIPAIDMLNNVLAWQYAKTMAGDRVSNEQLRIAREAIGAKGVWTNQQSSTVRLGQLREMFLRDMGRMQGLVSPEVQGLMSPYLSGVPAAVPGQPGTPQRMRFDANGDPIP